MFSSSMCFKSSNNTNKLSPQEHKRGFYFLLTCSNNTNKLSPQELHQDYSA